ncbi:MAG: Fic family protein, partial [Fibrobacterota bacterium]
TEQVVSLLRALGAREMGTRDLMKALNLSHRPTFLANYLDPALKAGLVERTDPDSPRSPRQKYRLTGLGLKLANARRKKVDE